MRLTNNYNLKMPEGSDVVNIEDLNYNANVIDNTLLQNKNDILNIIEVTNSMGSEIEVLKDKVSSLDCDYVEDIEFQFSNGWIKSASEYCSAKMINGVAYINLLCSGGINTAGTSICYIKDQKFRPKTNIPFIIGTNDGLYVNGFVRTTGNIVIDSVDIPPSIWISICVSYPIL